ncbi:MAG: pre-peptidase C-terminal domain-containing protein [Thermoanaerobaculia bacterium]
MDKKMRRTNRILPLAAAGLLLSLTAQLAGAQSLREGGDSLSARSIDREELRVAPDAALLSDATSFATSATQSAWQAFANSKSAPWIAYVDKRTGMIDYAEGGNLAWIPGAGNQLTAADLGLTSNRADLATLESIARRQLAEVGGMLGVDAASIALNPGRSGQPANHVWFVDFDILSGGRPVEGARVVFYVNNGNLIGFGTENLPAPGTKTPALRVSIDAARSTFFAHVDGFQAGDTIVDNGTYHLLPTGITSRKFAEGYAPGNGRGIVGVWEFTFKREGVVGTWRGRVDGATGALIEFRDVNDYGSASGGTYQGDRPVAERVLPLPFTNYAAGSYTNSAGIFTGTTGTTTLQGQYVKITDSCGATSKAADGTGAILLGSGTGTDCTIPTTGGGAGNTHAARTQFYNINRAKEIGRGWLPSNSWLGASVTVKVNLNQTCNAYWDGSALNFFKSGGGCANTGELPGVSLHEWGHGLDTNDGNSDSADNGTGESYGDFSAALFIHKSCIGNGFLGSSNCGGYGNACTACSGVRDIDWAKHAANTPSTVDNMTRAHCPTDSTGYVGPCGREGHCESYVPSEALWDFANRDLPSPGSGSAWATTDRLWYLSRSTATKAMVCTHAATPWTANGCSVGTLWRSIRAVDDDNGNLNDGTPHGAALGAAFNRHGIACTTDTAWNTTFVGVTPPAAPSLSITPGNNSAALTWSGSSGVYDIYRNESGCNAGFIKAANDVSATSYTDNNVANGLAYYYQVVAQPSGNEAAASAPSTCQTVTPAGAACTPPGAPTGVSASTSAQTTASVSWTAASGATSYAVSRSTTSGGPYTSVGSAAASPFADSGLTCNTTYYYVVSASNGSCSSANSTQASVTTAACTGGGSVLSNGVPVTGISGALNSQQNWTMPVPAASSALKFQISGGTGDADMYVRFGAAPTLTTYDCRPYVSGNAEVCNFATPSTGTYYVMLNGYAAYSGVTLVGSYTTGGGGCTATTEVEPNDTRTAPQAISGACNQISGNFTNDAASNQNDYFRLSLPAGATVTALLNGLTVDYDLYIYNSPTAAAVASSTAGGSAAETASWTNTGASAVNVYVRAYRYSATKTTYALKVSY